MALYEFYCDACKHKFEQITSDRDPDRGKCPKCQSKSTRKLISRFAVGGQGDLRESTLHGCHDCYAPCGEESSASSHSHDSGHDHDHGHGHDHD